MTKVVYDEVAAAVRAGDIQKLRSLKGKVDFEALVDPEYGANPLFWAIDLNSPAVLRFFLNETTIDVNKTNNRRTTPLLFAVESPHRLEVVKLLLAKPGINLHIRGASGMTALERADEEYHTVLREAGAEVPLTETVFSVAIDLNKKWIVERFYQEHPTEIVAAHVMHAARTHRELAAFFTEKLLHGSFVSAEHYDDYFMLDFGAFFAAHPDVEEIQFLYGRFQISHILTRPIQSASSQAPRLTAALLRKETSCGEQQKSAMIIIFKPSELPHQETPQATSATSSHLPQRCTLPTRERDISFAQAIIQSDLKKISELAQQGADVNQLFNGTETAAHFAIAENNIELLGVLASFSHFNQNSKNAYGTSLVNAIAHLTSLVTPPWSFIEAAIKTLTSRGPLQWADRNRSGFHSLHITRANDRHLRFAQLRIKYDRSVDGSASAQVAFPFLPPDFMSAQSASSSGQPVVQGDHNPPQCETITIRGDGTDVIPDQYKGISLPPGTYTKEEFDKALKQRYEKFLEEQKKVHKCALCQKDASSRCAKCKKVYYCSGECQKNHWPDHRAEFHVPAPCSICLEIVADARQEQCGHQFHASCIAKWIKATCPVCKANLNPAI